MPLSIALLATRALQTCDAGGCYSAACLPPLNTPAAALVLLLRAGAGELSSGAAQNGTRVIGFGMACAEQAVPVRLLCFRLTTFASNLNRLLDSPQLGSVPF